MLPSRRSILGTGAAFGALALAGCAGLGFREPVSVVVVGIDPVPGESMEARFALKLRVQNPNEQPLEFDGIHVELDVRGSRLASGVSAQRGTVARFGETVITVPMSVSVVGIIRQAVDIATSQRVRTDYAMRGRLAGPGLGFGGARFESKGEVQLPKGLLEPRE
jgi:LEA14-like dessication related protein